MPPQDLLVMIRKRPFVPFRVHVSDGTVYEIRHPELVMTGLGSAVIGVPSDPNQPLYERTETVALRHIVRLEPLEVTASN
jgi:hypothetical protein